MAGVLPAWRSEGQPASNSEFEKYIPCSHRASGAQKWLPELFCMCWVLLALQQHSFPHKCFFTVKLHFDNNIVIANTPLTLLC